SPYLRGYTVLTLAGLALFCPPAYTQRGGGGSPQGSGTPAGGSGRSPGGIGQTPSGNYPATPPAIFLNGRVMLEDGSPPPDRAAIVMLCSTRPRVEGHTDAKGYFTIQLGSPSPDALDDASVGGIRSPGLGDSSAAGGAFDGARSAFGSRDLIGCELKAQLPGYDSQSIELGSRQRLDNPNVGTILMRRLGQSEGSVVSATTLAAPKDARKAYEKGLDLLKKNKPAEAQASFEKAVENYPRYAIAWSELGKLQAVQGQPDAARASLERAIAADPKFVLLYVEMSEVEYRGQQWKELAETSGKAIALDAFHYPQALFFNAVANYNLHNLDRAEESARRAEKLDVNHKIPQISQLLARIQSDRQTASGAPAP
ncbi:MAG: tetratricopeptide repeat protein, partial [Acidobacteriia bacterium]|nr:tetratricopeptide repeat protein [Terriglobia bacterium]